MTFRARASSSLNALVVLTALVAVASCSDASDASGAGDGSGANPTTFATTPATVLTSDAGRLRVAVHSAPDPQPSRGVNALRLVVTRPSGEPASGLAIEVVLWMPAMGHGASVKPTVTPSVEPGVYVVDDVNLFMPGRWEVRATFTDTLQVDHATAPFEIR